MRKSLTRFQKKRVKIRKKIDFTRCPYDILLFDIRPSTNSSNSHSTFLVETFTNGVNITIRGFVSFSAFVSFQPLSSCFWPLSFKHQRRANPTVWYGSHDQAACQNNACSIFVKFYNTFNWNLIIFYYRTSKCSESCWLFLCFLRQKISFGGKNFKNPQSLHSTWWFKWLEESVNLL